MDEVEAAPSDMLQGAVVGVDSGQFVPYFVDFLDLKEAGLVDAVEFGLQGLGLAEAALAGEGRTEKGHRDRRHGQGDPGVAHRLQKSAHASVLANWVEQAKRTIRKTRFLPLAPIADLKVQYLRD